MRAPLCPVMCAHIILTHSIWMMLSCRAVLTDPELQRKALIFFPSVLVAVVSPSAFYGAMNLSGTYFVPTIFCLAPPLMAWLVRYKKGPWPFDKQTWNGRDTTPLVPGGRTVLLGFALGSIGLMAFVGEYSVFQTVVRWIGG